MQMQQANGEIAQTGEGVRGSTVTGATAIFVIGHVAHVMQAILDAPMAAVQGQQLWRVGLRRRQAGDEIDALAAGGGVAEGEDFAFQAGDLLDVWELQIGIEGGAGPDAADFEAAVAFIDGAVLRGE